MLQPAMMAGHHTLAADPPTHSLKGHRSDPSSSAMPATTFPNSRVTFQLQTPVDRGIAGLGEFRQPEKNLFKLVSQDRAGNFARGRGACLHYRHMQQSAKYLVPMLPTHSRTVDLDRVYDATKRHELQRSLTLESLEQNEKRRQARLHHARALLHTKSLKHEINQKLQASCSLPDLGEDPCGEQTPVLKLLNRRVDINRLKKCRRELAYESKREVVKQAIVQTPELTELMEDISRFEEDHLADLKIILETVVDWKNSSTISFGMEEARLSLQGPEELGAEEAQEL